MAIAAMVAVHRNTVAKWWRTYECEGAKGLRARRRGRRIGEQLTLFVEQEMAIQLLICDKNPDQSKLNLRYGPVRAVQELIAIRLQVRMPIRTVGEYLSRWGFTRQKPLKRAYEQHPAAVRQWLCYDYPGIAAHAKQEQAEVHWGDKTGIRNDSQYGRSWAPRGQTPVIRLSAKRASMNMISTLTNQGKVRFMIYSGTMNAQRLLQFFNQLIKTANKKIFLILDNLRIHHAKLVKKWLAKKFHAQKIEVFFLPAYSPEMNPDEYLNSDLKLVCMPSPRSGIRPHLSKTIMRTRVCYNTPQIA